METATQKLFLYNSLTSKKEQFVPLNPSQVGMYTCGITVYHPTHIGHIKKYVGDDLIRRSLEFLGYSVKHVQNVTDVGHLTSDSDEGEDKMEKGARILNTDVFSLAKKLTEEFYAEMKKVNVLYPTIVQNASSDVSIKEQLDLIKILFDKGFAYKTELAVYFDTSKLQKYNPFSSQKLEDKIKGARSDVITDKEKRNPADFALWVFTKGIHANHIMRWTSPWGEGFPGWHIECSAISINNLGDHFDIHTGGIDHKEVHHPNEIAQNFGVFSKKVVNYWVHHNFLLVDNKKMSKSLNNFYTLADVEKKGFSPLDFRYFILQAHYRSEINFTWKALEDAKNSRESLVSKISSICHAELVSASQTLDVISNQYYNSFLSALCDDINIPKALSVLWGVVRDETLDATTKCKLISEFDKVLALDLIKLAKEEAEKNEHIPSEILELAKKREEARAKKDFNLSDILRDEIKEKGFEIEDSDGGFRLVRI